MREQADHDQVAATNAGSKALEVANLRAQGVSTGRAKPSGISLFRRQFGRDRLCRHVSAGDPLSAHGSCP